MEPAEQENHKQEHSPPVEHDIVTSNDSPNENESPESRRKKSSLSKQRSFVTPSLLRKQSSSSSNGPPAMKAVFVSQIGGPLRVADILIPQPGQDEVLIKIEAAPINPSDLGFLTGHYVHLHPPFQIGLEGSGTVMSSGGGSSANSLVGKRVSFGAAPARPGSWAQYIVTQAQNCFELDKNVSFEHGSCGIINPFTAIAFLETLKKEKHKTVVRTAAASQLGRMMTRLLKKEGIRTIDIVRKPEQKKILEELGSEVVLISEEEGFEQELKKRAEEMKATCLLECICGENTYKIIKAMPRNTMCYIYGHLAEDHLTKVDMTDLLANHKTIKPFTFMTWFSAQGVFSRIRAVWKLQKMLLNELKTDIAKVFPMEEINEAVKYYSENMTEGKVIIKPWGVEHPEEHKEG